MSTDPIIRGIAIEFGDGLIESVKEEASNAEELRDGLLMLKYACQHILDKMSFEKPRDPNASLN